MGVFIILGVMFVGVGLGFLLRKLDWLKHTSKTISYTIYLLLFLLGISVGSNEKIVDNLASLGSQALILALAGALGSALAAWAIYRWWFKQEEQARDER